MTSTVSEYYLLVNKHKNIRKDVFRAYSTHPPSFLSKFDNNKNDKDLLSMLIIDVFIEAAQVDCHNLICWEIARRSPAYLTLVTHLELVELLDGEDCALQVSQLNPLQ